MKWHVVLVIFFVQFVIVVIAGIIIHFLEAPSEQRRSDMALKRFNNFRASRPCLTNEDTKRLYDSIEELARSELTFRKEDFGTSWDFQSSFYASMQIVSGAGFGASPPKTVGGKVFFVFYAMIGVALFVVVAFGLGQQMLKVSDFIRRKIWSTATHKDSWKVFLFRSTLLVFTGFIIFSVISAGIFCSIDKTLNYGETLSIISIISVGPGDFIPGGRNSTMFQSWYRLLVGFWTIASIIWFAGVFSTIRRSLLQYYNDVETPPALDENKVSTSPLRSVVDVATGPNKTTTLYTSHEKAVKYDVISGHISSINVGRY